MPDEAELMSWDIGRLRYEFRAAQKEIEIADGEIERLKLVLAEERAKHALTIAHYMAATKPTLKSQQS